MSRLNPSVTVAERPKGSGKYSVRWREDGKQREERGYEDPDEAEGRATQIRQRLRSQIPGVRSELTVRGAIVEFTNEYADDELGEGTNYTYAYSLKLVLDSPIAGMRAADVTTGMIQRAVKDWISAGASPHTVRNALTALSSTYQRCIEWELIESNPVRGVRRPKTRRGLIVIPTGPDLIRLGVTVPSPDAKWRSLLLVAAFCGLRPQEQFALKWGSIEADHVYVREALGARTRVVGATKTELSDRRVPLPPFVRAELERWRAQTPRPGVGDHVWSTLTGSVYMNSTFGTRVWRPWRDLAGAEHIEWRTMRHHYASTLARSGASALQASRWMGHSSVRITYDKYGFLFDGDTDQVMRNMASSMT